MTQTRDRISRGAWSWALFEWARNPYIILCIIYVMAPYIANVVIGDPVKGQTLISSWSRTAGLLVALTAPFLGAAADRMGHRKPLLAVVIAVFAPAIFIQYWALPHEAGLPLWALGGAVITAAVCYTWTEVLHNSMLTTSTKPALISHVSGLGLALGNASSLLLLVFVLGAFALPGIAAIPGLPDHPLFGLNAARFEPSRIVTPICALWLVVFSVPLFVFTPDRNPTGEAFFAALRRGVANVWRTVAKLFAEYRNTALYLVARMLYVDGTTAVVIFAGVYASGVLGWNLIEMLAFGVTLSIFAVLGGFAAAWLDTWFGAKRAVMVEVIVTFVCLMIQVSISPSQILFVIAADPAVHVWSGPVFQTAPELVYLAASCVIAVSITAAYASSRALMAQLCPAGMEGEIFGLYALSGSATAWLAPLCVEVFTSTYQSQRVGFGSIGILLIAGFLLVAFVKAPLKPR